MSFKKGDRVRLLSTVSGVKGQRNSNTNRDVLINRVLIVDHYMDNVNEPYTIMCVIEGGDPSLYAVLEDQIERV